jgi:hypothetical protein
MSVKEIWDYRRKLLEQVATAIEQGRADRSDARTLRDVCESIDGLMTELTEMGVIRG